ncbi:MAG TPA: hypothetical protein VGC35_09695 [Allosphingosinicella sp.]|jgi:hypothetical protein
MSYSTYLRQQASDCIGEAVAGAGKRGTGALIDLAEHYSTWASTLERQVAEGQAPACAFEDAEEPSGLWRLVPWLRH